MVEKKLETSIGMSLKWDAREAGKEVVRSTIEKLNKPPKFFVLYSTIHYKKNGGFKEFLKGVWDVLPEDTPLIGGTVVGFMTREGVYSRGAVGVAFSGDINVENAVARGTRKNPKKAVSEISKLIKGNDSLILAFLPGPSMPNLKKDEKIIVTKSKTLASIAPKALEFSTKHFNKGVGREMEILEHLSKSIKSDIVGCSTIDDNKYNDSYQFFNKDYYSDSLVILNIKNLKYDLNSIGTIPIPEKWYSNVKKKTFGHILEKIEGESALSFYLNKLGYSSEMIFEEPDLVHRRFVFAPVLTKDEYGGIHPRCPGTFYGDTMGFGHPIIDSVGFSLTDGKFVNKQFINFIKNFDQDKIRFLFIFSCAVLFEALGRGLYRIHEEIIKYLDDDFLILFGGGEIISEKIENNGPKILEMSLTGVGFH
jgi:hypothetical protein